MLLFDVENQVITRRDRFSPATDSVKYLKAKFNFKTDDWSDKSKTAVFTVFDKKYPAVIDSNNVCLIPWEALAYTVENNYRFAVDNYIYVSVVGIKGDIRITTDKVKILLNLSGYGEWENTTEPTPDVYTQYVNLIKDSVDEVYSVLNDTKEVKNETVAINEEIKNSYSNAFKGSASGNGVRVDDVSPVEHTLKVKATGKNLIDISKIELTSTINEEYPYVTAVGESYIDITVSETYNGNGHIAIPLTLKEICPQLVAGKTYFISANSDAWNKCLYLKQVDCFWNFGNALTITEEMLDCTLGLYGYATLRGQSPGTCRISNIQIEEGTVATEYVPYVDPTSVTVSRYGKNLFPSTNERTLNGVTLSKFGDYYILNGTATDSAIFHLVTGYIPKGTYTISANNPKHNGLDLALVQIYSDTLKYQLTAKDNAVNSSATATIQTANDWQYRIRIEKGVTYNKFIIKPQLELGDVATEYEEYIAPETYVPNEDGSVDGVKSLSPTVTLLSDNANATIELEYNRDINVALDYILNKSSRIAYVTLLSSNWNGEENLYSQVVTIDGTTKNTQVDLTPSVEQLAVFYNKDLAFVTENENGVITVYAIGQKPQNDYTIQVTLTEVAR